MSATAERDLRALLGPEAVLPGATRQYLIDATESRAVRGTRRRDRAPVRRAAGGERRALVL